MNVQETDLPGVLLIEPDRYTDVRGYFQENWNQVRYSGFGIPDRFVQDNLSRSHFGVLRGLHFQEPNAQAKLVSVLEGEVFDVAVDMRQGSPTFASWVSYVLSAENARQLYIPEGFAHGFVVLSDTALFSYKCTALYDPKCEGAILWNDPDLGIEWPVLNPALSAKDARAPRLAEIVRDRLPQFSEPLYGLQ